ncbi:MAG TPA: hypothetical protein VN229_03605 [Terriglobales bacterium]|nr:hypothetical protein [Terriglobales bacterium]
MLARFGLVVGWFANGLAILFLVMAVFAFFNNSGGNGIFGAILFLILAAIVFIGGRAVRFIIFGPSE